MGGDDKNDKETTGDNKEPASGDDKKEPSAGDDKSDNKETTGDDKEPASGDDKSDNKEAAASDNKEQEPAAGDDKGDNKKAPESMVSVIDDAQEQDVPHGPNVMKMVMCIAAGGFVIGLGLLGYLLVVRRYSAREIAEPTVEMASTSSELA